MKISQEHRTQPAPAPHVSTYQGEKAGRSTPLNADTPPLSTERIIAQLNQLHDLIRQHHARS